MEDMAVQNPYAMLGIAADASAEQIRSAYHALVKRCHPDSIQEPAARDEAQSALVQLNLAYAEAMRRANLRTSSNVVVRNAMHTARQLFERGQLDGALRMLNKAPERDAEWFVLQGDILLKKGEADAAHACFRSAVRMDPDNLQHRERALAAAVQMKKGKTLRGRVNGWAKGVASRVL